MEIINIAEYGSAVLLCGLMVGIGYYIGLDQKVRSTEVKEKLKAQELWLRQLDDQIRKDNEIEKKTKKRGNPNENRMPEVPGSDNMVRENEQP